MNILRSCNALRLLLFSVVGAATILIAPAQAGPLGSFSGGMFNDTNSNGIKDPGETGIRDAGVLVVGPSGLNLLQTSSTGSWLPNEFIPGRYQIIPPTGIGGLALTSGDGAGILEATINPGLTTNVAVAFHETCVPLSKPKVLWTIGSNGQPTGASQVSFTITNNNTWSIGRIFVDPQNGTYTGAQPIHINPPLAPGASRTITIPMSGLQPNSETCISLDFHSADLENCCSERLCFEVPDCDCYQVLSQEVICLPDGRFQVNVQLQNISVFNVTRVWTQTTGNYEISPEATVVSLPPGGVFNFTMIITGSTIGGTQVCPKIMFFSGGTLCCTKPLCIDLPKCDVCDARPPVCYAVRPTYNVGNNPGQVNYNGPEWTALNGKTVAAVTCYSSWTNDDPSNNNTGSPMRFLDNVVFGYQNLDQYQTTPPILGQNWTPTPLGFHNGLDSAPNLNTVPPEARWTKRYMGNVFAITFDNLGNAYVAQTSCYNADYAPLITDFNLTGVPGRNHTASSNEVADGRLHGRIFKIANGTGKVTIFNEDTTSQWNGLPSGNDPAITSIPNRYPGSGANQRPEIQMSSQGFPEVGDVTFDYDHNQIFATSLDDGKIYRFNLSGQKVGTPFDPWAADTGAPFGDGFAARGENIWAAKYHRGRVYYSRWNEDLSVSSVNSGNEIWSVAISNSAPFGFVPNSERYEVTTPNLSNVAYGIPLTATAPVCDITFSKEGSSPNEEGMMFVAERGMGRYWHPLNGNPSDYLYEQMNFHASSTGPSMQDAFTNTFPHRSRLLKFVCNPTTSDWELMQNNSSLFGLGGVNGTNCAGGVDFDFDNRGNTAPGFGNRIWAMADAMNTSSAWAYGLQGVALGGGSMMTSIIQDLDSDTTPAGTPKTTLGDVEIPCPVNTGGGFGGNITLPHFQRPADGRAIFANVMGNGVSFTLNSVVEPNGRVQFSGDIAPGNYWVYLEFPGHLKRKVEVSISSGIVNFGSVTLTPGDADCDNEVGPLDFEIITAAFGKSFGEPGYLIEADFDWNGEIGPGDFELVVQNFGGAGD